MKKTLDLVLKSKWYDMITSGEKREEYREIKTYWENRLMCQPNFGCGAGRMCKQVRNVLLVANDLQMSAFAGATPQRL